MKKTVTIMDGNEAAAYIAYKCSELCALYPITPSSPMGEYCDEWSAEGKKNVFGTVPAVVEMQSEGGAAGAIHGSLMGGALSSTFTCSQGLLLMIPNMYKIAGELTPAVFHIAARTIATHALSIFGDHSDVMAVRQTGWAMLFGRNAQEAMDMAMISHAATLRARIPFLNIFDGFRTSHELSKVNLIPDSAILQMLDEKAIHDFRKRALSPDTPSIKGTAQNPDVFFQGREAANPYYSAAPSIVESVMKEFKNLTGREYGLCEYYGHEAPEHLVIVSGSAAGTVCETIDELNAKGGRTGCVYVRLFRPFPVSGLVNAIPRSVKSIAVLDRCKEPGGVGDPLYMDVTGALSEAWKGTLPLICGGRYGLASKEFSPAMAKAVFDELKKEKPARHFTVGINDDVSGTSLAFDAEFSLESQHEFRGLFYGLGADGTVSANKNSIKIIGETTDRFVQGYFVYDSKKSGSLTVSHLRFGRKPIRSAYLIGSANFIACHQYNYIHKLDILRYADEGAVLLLNTAHAPEETWGKLPARVQDQIIARRIRLFVVNASGIARKAGLGSRINTILQACFFSISGILPREEAVDRIKEAVAGTYSGKGEAVLKKNFEAIDAALLNIHEVKYEGLPGGNVSMSPAMNHDAPVFVKEVLQKIAVQEGDELPVSVFPPDGTYPVATTQWEKRGIGDRIPVWDKELCSQCGKCYLICPHAAIRCKVYDKKQLENAPGGFQHTRPVGKEFVQEEEVYTLQVSPDDCTGCNLCVEYCPVESKASPGQKAIRMEEAAPLKETEKANWEFFLSLPEFDRDRANRNAVKGTQLLQPLFEFSGACSGCGETPYLKLLSQLYGDRMVIANATGCSSIYGGNLPTTPWALNHEGRGPAWGNSLFEDNAEFGLGLKLAHDKQKEMAHTLLLELREQVGAELADRIFSEDQGSEAGIRRQRHHLLELNEKLKAQGGARAAQLRELSGHLLKKTHWIIGGDGWAYDIGFGGLDHVLSSGKDVNIMVLDTEVYSNTGGQMSKSTPMGAAAKFSVNGKTGSKKDLALQAIAHGSAYVAQIAMGANDLHALRTIQEAEAFPGPSLLLCYSHCIAHGYNMSQGALHQALAVKSGYWPLFRFNPLKPGGERFSLDCKEPSLPLQELTGKETRFSPMKEDGGERALQAQEALKARWERLLLLKGL